MPTNDFQIIEVVEDPQESMEEKEESIDQPEAEEIFLYDEKPSEDVVLELHDALPETESGDLSVSEPPVELKFNGIPGVDQDEFVEEIEVKEEKKEEDKTKKPKDIWDWKAYGLENFYNWLNERWHTVPSHKGTSVNGAERAKKYLEELLKCVSSALSSDLNGILDIDKVDNITGEIEKGIVALNGRIKQLGKSSKTADIKHNIIKEAQKIPGIGGIVVTVPLLISRVARTCINGMVSNGHDIEKLFSAQVKIFKLSEREQAETIQLIHDMGYSIPSFDRMTFGDKETEETELATNYQA